jgi:hypothetical protein
MESELKNERREQLSGFLNLQIRKIHSVLVEKFSEISGMNKMGEYSRESLEYKKAIDLFTRSAMKGNATAMLNLGEILKMGYGVEINYSEAFKLRFLFIYSCSN